MAVIPIASKSLLPSSIEPSGRSIILGDATPAGRVLQDEQPGQQESGVNFGDLLSNAINQVNDVQKDSAAMQQALLNGENVELHDVMIKAEQAGISMDLMLEVRNRLVNGFNELMRMPM
ncbi:MAG: flagellar hook-basal body complex protein FliE [Candidatus Zixiibacteriota bacterium]